MTALSEMKGEIALFLYVLIYFLFLDVTNQAMFALLVLKECHRLSLCVYSG